MGLTLCVVAGGDLFTSNAMYAAVGFWEGAPCACWKAILGCLTSARS